MASKNGALSLLPVPVPVPGLLALCRSIPAVLLAALAMAAATRVHAAADALASACPPPAAGQTALRIHLRAEPVAPAAAAFPADGHTRVTIHVQAEDLCRQPLPAEIPVTVDSGGLQLENPDAPAVPAAGAAKGRALMLHDGRLDLWLRAPAQAGHYPLRVLQGGQEQSLSLEFTPVLRPLIAAGIVEGTLHLGRQAPGGNVPATGLDDGFSRALRSFQRQFDGGQMNFAARSSLFVKGAVGNDTLLTATFDSDKDLADRTLKDINPDRYYPVLGDSARRGVEGSSSDRLFLRLDRARDYLMYGDFNTGGGADANGLLPAPAGAGAPLQQRQLGQYSRTMTGIRAHAQDDSHVLDGFVMRDTLRQAIEEYRGNGTSGPYAVGNLNAVENSEVLEVVVRDRNNPARILSTTALQRYLDYSFEPFSGRILLKSPLPALDPELNPISLRITYAVDTGGAAFWVFGVSGQQALGRHLEVGGSWVKDTDPAPPSGGTGYATTAGSPVAVPRELRELVSANLGWQTGAHDKLVAEVAQARSATPDGDITGRAARLEWQGQGGSGSSAADPAAGDWQARVWAGGSGRDFNNPAAPLSGGRVEAGIKASADLAAATRVLIDGVRSEDRQLQAGRSGEALRVQQGLGDGWQLEAGVRHVQQDANAALSLSTSGTQTLPGQAPVFSGSGLNPAGAGFWGQGVGLNPQTGQPQSALNGQVVNNPLATPAIDASTVRLGISRSITPAWRAGVELGRDYGLDDSAAWLAAQGEYRVADLRAFARLEEPTHRASVGADYRVDRESTVYARLDSGSALAPGYALDASAHSQAFVAGVRQSTAAASESYEEYRLDDGMNGREVQNAAGLRQTVPLADHLSGQLFAERLRILDGAGRSASALGGGVEWKPVDWRVSERLEWRSMDRTPGGISDDGAVSWMDTLAVARKLNADWTGLARDYLLLTDSHAVPGTQLQNRFQLGGAYRPVLDDDFDALFLYENKFQRNQEISPQERSLAHVLSLNFNQRAARDWTGMGRIAAKTVDDDLAGVHASYSAWLLSGRVIHDLSARFDAGVMASVMGSPQGGTRQYAYGVELGYLLARNVWASMGLNLSGFSDRDLTGSDYTQRGLYLRLRMKFDELGLKALAGAVQSSAGEDLQ